MTTAERKAENYRRWALKARKACPDCGSLMDRRSTTCRACWKVALAAEFEALIEKTASCWLWIGNIDGNTGYGRYGGASGGRFRAHRLAFIRWRGPIPEGMHVHHTCRTKHCVNPDHLELVEPGTHVRLHEPWKARWGA